MLFKKKIWRPLLITITVLFIFSLLITGILFRHTSHIYEKFEPQILADTFNDNTFKFLRTGSKNSHGLISLALENLELEIYGSHINIRSLKLKAGLLKLLQGRFVFEKAIIDGMSIDLPPFKEAMPAPLENTVPIKNITAILFQHFSNKKHPFEFYFRKIEMSDLSIYFNYENQGTGCISLENTVGSFSGNREEGKFSFQLKKQKGPGPKFNLYISNSPFFHSTLDFNSFGAESLGLRKAKSGLFEIERGSISGYLKITEKSGRNKITGEGTFEGITIKYRGFEKGLVAAGRFVLDDKLLRLLPPKQASDSPGRLLGSCKLERELELNMEISSSDLDISNFLSLEKRMFDFLSNHTFSGHSALFLKLRGPLEKPVVIGEIAIKLGVLQGKEGYFNISGITGTIRFNDSRFIMDRLTGFLGKTPIIASGHGSIEEKGPYELTVTFPSLDKYSLSELLSTSHSKLETLLGYLDRGRFSLELVFSRDSEEARVRGKGYVDSGDLILKTGQQGEKPTLVENLSGPFEVYGGVVKSPALTAFFGDLPIIISGTVISGENPQYELEVKLENLTSQELNLPFSVSPDADILPLALGRNSKVKMTFNNQKGYPRSRVEFSLNDLELVFARFGMHVSGLKVAGILTIDFFPDGSIRITDVNVNLKGPVKFLFTTRLFAGQSLILSGDMTGALTTGDVSWTDVILDFTLEKPRLRYRQPGLFETSIDLNGLHGYLELKKKFLKLNMSGNLLEGTGRLGLLHEKGGIYETCETRLSLEGLNLFNLYEQNPGLPPTIGGTLDLHFLASSKHGSIELDGEWSVRNGKLTNLPLLSGYFKMGEAPTSIAFFNRIGSRFRIRDGMLELTNLQVDCNDKTTCEYLKTIRTRYRIESYEQWKRTFRKLYELLPDVPRQEAILPWFEN